jgi:ATP diphosphatase
MAVALQAKAGTVGFDWNSAKLVLKKIREEIEEVDVALDGSADERLDEIGDLLFAVANLARHAKTDPDVALRRANAKFERRFRFIEAELAKLGRTPAQSTLEEMDKLWDAAKAVERT